MKPEPHIFCYVQNWSEKCRPIGNVKIWLAFFSTSFWLQASAVPVNQVNMLLNLTNTVLLFILKFSESLPAHVEKRLYWRIKTLLLAHIFEPGVDAFQKNNLLFKPPSAYELQINLTGPLYNKHIILAWRWVRNWTHRGWLEVSRFARWVWETSGHPRCVQFRTHRTCKY